MNNKHYLCIIIILLQFCATFAHSETIHVYTYHNHPPFVTGKNKGLSFDLQQSLNRHAQGKYSFSVEVLPRSRLNMILKPWISGACLKDKNNKSCKKNWMVVWVNPKWGFGKNAMTQYFWSMIHEDSNSIISLQKTKIPYNSPESLAGLRFGGMRGHRYLGIDELASEKKLIRIDGNRERDNILKLLMGRIDVILLPTSTINYFVSSPNSGFTELGQKLYISPQKHQVYARHFMIPRNNKELFQWVEAFAKDATDWNLLLEQKQLLPSNH